MYMADCIRGTVDFIEADPKVLKYDSSGWILINTSRQRTYNLAAVSFSPKQIIAEIEKQLGYKLDVTYDPDFRDGIAQSWPKSLDDSNARRDWGWKHEYGLPEMTAG